MSEEGLERFRVGIVTVSDTRTLETDESGPLVRDLLGKMGFRSFVHEIVKDEEEAIVEVLERLCRECDLVVTTGGTGLSPRDVTPEATLKVVDKRVWGLEEQLRREGCEETPYAVLSRGVVGCRGKTLVVNLPGSPSGVRRGIAVLGRVLEHALSQLRGDRGHSHSSR
ncbi:MAG: MogA/MoaB family molybdenum cofactor biosynthesis protein [Candidatus Caldarchaeum sp.]